MNPAVLIKAWYRQYPWSAVSFIFLFSVAISLGLALMVQERAIKASSAKVSNQFELIVGAPGSDTTLVMSTVFLQSDFLETLPVGIWHQLINENAIDWFAPLTFGDFYQGYPIIGTTSVLSESVYGTSVYFEKLQDAWVGASVPLASGEAFTAEHGLSFSDEVGHHSEKYIVQGQLPYTGTPWDRAILVPVESSWKMHGLGDGHTAPPTVAALSVSDKTVDLATPKIPLGEFNQDSPLKPVSAFVVKPKTLAAAYQMRSRYRSLETQAVFPAEVMARLYSLMGDARTVLSQITLVCEALVIIALIFGVNALFALFRREFVVLRLIGASQQYLLITSWLYICSLMFIGVFVALAFALFETKILSLILTHHLHFLVGASLTINDFGFVALTLLFGSLIALLPAWRVFRLTGRQLLLQDH